MNRRKFLGAATGIVVIVGSSSYLLSDKHNLVRDNTNIKSSKQSPLEPDEREILYLASLTPSGHNTQPWFVNSSDDAGIGRTLN
jgi:hypothetical protein